MPLITLKNVKKKYDQTHIINDLNLKLHNNEFTVFIGPSGCGKSTILRLISGLEKLSSGEIYIGDQNISSLPPAKRNLSMVFQDYALYPHMNIYDNIAFSLKLHKTPQDIIIKKVSHISKLMEINALLMRKPAELSGGQRQRVAMARALIKDTNILLMDEPLSNLDAHLRTTLRNELLVLKKKIKRNVIYVTHDQTEAMTLADRIVILNKGSVQQYDKPKVLYENPANKFVAQFLGTPKINILQASIECKNDDIYLKNNHFSLKLSAEQKRYFKGYTHKKINIGIRPQYFEITSEKNIDNYFKCRIQVKEYIGSNYIVTALCDQQTLQFEVNANNNNLHKNTFFYLKCHTNKLYFFDIQSNCNITSF